MTKSYPQHNAANTLCYTTLTYRSMIWPLFTIVMTSFFLRQDSIAAAFVWGFIIVLLFIFRRMRFIVGTPSIWIIWIWVFTALTLTTISSRSIGASLTAYISYSLGFLIYIFASQISSANLSGVTVWAYRFFNTIILLFLMLFAVKVFLPELHILPIYNGIIAVNGHHPIAYLIVLGFPLLLETWRRTGSKNSLMLVMYAVFALLLSASRGAMVLIGLWSMGLALIDRKWQKNREILRAIVILVFTMFLGIHWISGFSFEQKRSLINKHPILSVFIKENPRDDLRKEFLNQSIRGITQSPLLGNGPGTFALVSRAFEGRPSVYTTHPHSFPMQQLSDLGLLGSIPVFILMGLIFFHSVKNIRHHSDTRIRALSWGLVLSLLYSIFEGNLNGIGMWVLWWAFAGFIRTNNPKDNRPAPMRFIRAQYGIIIIFVLSATLSTLVASSGHSNLAFRVAPYRKDLILQNLSRQLSSWDAKVLRFFYRQDPDIPFALASLEIDPAENYLKAIRLDPYNYHYWQQAIWNFTQKKNSVIQLRLLCQLIQQSDRLGSCHILQSPSVLPYLASPDFSIPIRFLQGSDGLSKFYYYLGLTLYRQTEDAETAINFWTLARDNALNWGYYHLELASAYYYWKNDPIEAQRVLDECRLQPYAKKGCVTMAKSPDELYAPGVYASDIAAIPAIQ